MDARPERILRWPCPGMLGLAVLASLSGNVAVAAASDDIFFAELPVVASLSRLPQRLSEAPGSVSVIDQEMIRASGFRTVEDLLRLVPGFVVTSHNQDPAVAVYHGLNTGLNGEEYGARMQVLVDGRSMYSPLFKSGVNWNLLPVALDNIERIEVIRGSNTVSYGSNAFLGVVNIITVDPSQTRGWLLSANQGNNAVSDQTLRWGGKMGAAEVRLTYRQFGDNGFPLGAYADDAWSDSPDDRRTRAFDLRASMPLDNRDELEITASQVEDVSLYGRPDRPLTDPIRYLGQRASAFGLQWRRALAADEEMRVRYNYAEDRAAGPYNRNYNYTSVSLPLNANTRTLAVQVLPGGRSASHELEFEHRLVPWRNTRMTWGGALRAIDVQSSDQYSTTDHKRRSAARAFANAEVRPAEDWVINAGVSVEHDSLSGLMVDPRFSVSYHLTPEQTVRLGVSRSHRSPSLYEMAGRVTWRAIGTTDPYDISYLGRNPDPERVGTLEAGYLGEWKALRASIDVRGFIERIPNRIQIVPLALPASDPDDREDINTRTKASNTAPYPYGRADGAINFERVVIRGYEYSLRWQPFDGTRLLYNGAITSIQANMLAAGVVADDIGNTTDKITDQTRHSAPLHSQSAMLVQKLPHGLQASVMYFRAGSMRWRRNSPELLPTDRLDWRLAKSFRIGPTRGELAYTMQFANGPEEGRLYSRLSQELHWLSLRLEY